MADPHPIPPVLADPDSSPQEARPYLPPESSRPSSRLRLHPYSGALVILLDNVFWGINAMTLGLSTPITSFLAFATTTCGVFLTQKFLDRDGFGASLAKAFFAGVLAGVPTPIAGSVFGSIVMLASGLSRKDPKNAPDA